MGKNCNGYNVYACENGRVRLAGWGKTKAEAKNNFLAYLRAGWKYDNYNDYWIVEA